jgi:serine/threonine protein kinase
MVKGKDKPKNLFPNKQIGPFLLIKKLGEGTQAEVWQAVYNGQNIAIKIGSNTSSVFYDASLKNRLGNHKNLFDVVGKEQSIDDYKIFPMELMKMTLEGLLKTNNYELNTIMIDLLDVAEYVKDQGYVFRDINPNNIMVNQNNIIKLIDIGVVSKIGSPSGFEGTAKFSSYNSLMGQNPSPWDDIYSILLVGIYIQNKGKLWDLDPGSTNKSRKEYAEILKNNLLPSHLSTTSLQNYYNYMIQNNIRPIENKDYTYLKSLFKSENNELMITINNSTLNEMLNILGGIPINVDDFLTQNKANLNKILAYMYKEQNIEVNYDDIVNSDVITIINTLDGVTKDIHVINLIKWVKDEVRNYLIELYKQNGIL